MIRDNANRLAGLPNQPKDYNTEKLSESEQAILPAHAFKAPHPARDGICALTLNDLGTFAEDRFGKRLSTLGMWGVTGLQPS